MLVWKLSGALTVTDWIPELIWVSVHGVYYWRYRTPRARAGGHGHPRACARGECCIVHNQEVATLAWKLKGALNGDRLDLVQDSPRARGGDHGHPRARVGSAVLSTIKKSPRWLGN